MKIHVRHGGYCKAGEYLEVLRLAFGQAYWRLDLVHGAATSVSVDFEGKMVDTEENVVHKVREALRRVDLPQWNER